jgi:RecB family endonuclease NucS
LLRYMGWVRQNMETTRPVRGMIVANEITADLKLAAMSMPLVKLIEYKLSFELSTVPPFS